MKTTRWILGASLLGSLWAIEGCGVGTYQIPNVEPVVKPKPEDDLLDDIEGNDTPSEAKPAEAPKPAAAKEAKPAETPKPAVEAPKAPEAAKAAESAKPAEPPAATATPKTTVPPKAAAAPKSTAPTAPKVAKPAATAPKK